MPLVLGVDSSTQSTKVEVRDADSGERVASGSAPHPPTSPPRSEQEPADWWAALSAAVAQAGVSEIAALAVGGQQHGLVALGPDDGVLRPAKLWNDTESASDADRLVEAGGGAQGWAEVTGSVPVASFTITKLAWLRRVEPETYRRLTRVLLPHDWLTFRLTGAFVTDRGDASGTGYWSPRENCWRTDRLRLVDDGPGDAGWAERLPTVLGPTEPAGELAPDAAHALGLTPGALVGAGTGDNMAAALGIGLAPGEVMVSLGTSGTVASVSDAPTADPTGIVAGFADASGRFLPLVCTLNATRVTDAFANLLGVDQDELAALTLTADPGAQGAVVIPYFDGERTPNRPDATGSVHGLTHRVGRADLARAAHEGVVCGLLDGLDALGAIATAPEGGRLVLVGGGARSPAYRHVVADLAQREVTLPANDELVATGACVQAAAALHGQSPQDVASAWGLVGGDRVEPTAGVDAEAIRARYARHRG